MSLILIIIVLLLLFGGLGGGYYGYRGGHYGGRGFGGIGLIVVIRAGAAVWRRQVLLSNAGRNIAMARTKVVDTILKMDAEPYDGPKDRSSGLCTGEGTKFPEGARVSELVWKSGGAEQGHGLGL